MIAPTKKYVGYTQDPKDRMARHTCGETQEWSGPIFSETPSWIMIRKGNDKMVIAREGDIPADLYDLEADPYEMTNLVDDSAHADLRSDLHAQIVAWHKEVAVPRF